MGPYADTASQSSALRAGAPTPEMALTESISSRLSDILGNAQSTVSRLTTIRDRTFGAPPPHAVDASGKNGTGDCRADEISMLLGHVYATVSEAESLAAELQSRL
jgi:hypothetical protein